MMKKAVYFIIFISMIIFSVGCELPGAGNDAPYVVTGPSEYSYTYKYNVPYTFSLTTNAPGAELDPDGDSTEFKVDDLPTGVTLNALTGEVTILMTVPFFEAYDKELSVWLEDEHGLDSQHFTVTIDFNPKS